ncbi:MAG: glycosyltransferase [Bacteroidota bacterium]|nr:glycosyltransferase [Bacteroidota bacterium]
MSVTLIISYYKALKNLKLIMKALSNQSYKDFELIISEDDRNEETLRFVQENRRNYFFDIIHLHQKEDTGFRKNSMLNRSVLQAAGERLIFIDGDCVPHKHFVKEYAKRIKEGFCYSGRAVMLDEQTTQKALKEESLEEFNFLKLLRTKSKKLKDGIYFPWFSLSHKARGLVGRNWGILKTHLIEINGFDEDYVLAGAGEDTDVEWRLRGLGIKLKSMKNRAFVYHLYHKRWYSEKDVATNFKMLRKKQESENYRCLNGMDVYDLK